MIPTLEQTSSSVEYNWESRNKPLHLVLSAKSLQSAPPLCDPLGTAAHKVPLSMGFSRKEYWSRLPFLSPGDLPNPQIEPRSPALGADSLPAEPWGKPKNTGGDPPDPGIEPGSPCRQILYHEWMMSFVKCFMCLFCKDLISFVYRLNSMDRFLMLKQCDIPGINVSLSWYIIFFNIIGFSF